jgi:hypothetical protein
MHLHHTRNTVALLLSALLASAAVQAQESANDQLDQCIQKEKVKTALKGSALGALAGFGKSLLVDKDKSNKDVAKNVAIGAVAGGAIGLVTAHYQAAGKCFRKNPSWVPESQLERSKGYEQAVKDYGYQPKQGTVAAIRELRVANKVQAGQKLDITMSFAALTPTGAETPVTIERKLFAVEPDGKEVQLPFMGKGSEERVMEAGEHTDHGSLPIPADGAGTIFRIEYSVSANKQAPAVRSALVTVI